MLHHGVGFASHKPSYGRSLRHFRLVATTEVGNSVFRLSVKQHAFTIRRNASAPDPSFGAGQLSYFGISFVHLGELPYPLVCLELNEEPFAVGRPVGDPMVCGQLDLRLFLRLDIDDHVAGLATGNRDLRAVRRPANFLPIYLHVHRIARRVHVSDVDGVLRPSAGPLINAVSDLLSIG
jgi:hypothetical protein